ncbi:hypothetical protein CLCAR_3083 [Clostridium carboxidivorans P7]|nr:hypothetical protein CLCAR_3083 [Clostridium carboxidivorans P7]
MKFFKWLYLSYLDVLMQNLLKTSLWCFVLCGVITLHRSGGKIK